MCFQSLGHLQHRLPAHNHILTGVSSDGPMGVFSVFRLLRAGERCCPLPHGLAVRTVLCMRDQITRMPYHNLHSHLTGTHNALTWET